MKTAVFLAASAAVLAVATPLNMEKRKMETEVVVEWKTVYVTQGVSPSIFAAAGHHNHHAPQATSSSTLTTPTFTPEPETVAPAPEPTTVAPSPDPTPVAPVTTTTVAPEPKIEPSPSETKAAAVDTPAAPVAAPPASSAAQDVGAQPTDYASAAVYHHNIHRLNYSSPALKWSDKHAGYAAETAAKCVFKHDMTPGNGGYGQNLALFGASGNVKAKSQSASIAEAITDMWHNGEVAAYPWGDAGKPNPDMSNFETWGHFSQVVWASTEQVGCATQFCEAGTIYDTMASWFTVCDYFPAGNMGGAYGKNVLPSLNEASVVV